MSSPLDFDPIHEARRQWAAHGWEDASAGMAAVTSVVRAQQVFLGRIDAVLRPLALTFARYEVLMLLLFSRRGSLPLNKIGSRLQVHPTSVTNAVDRLERQGLIRRVPHATDRRTTLAEISTVGRDLALRATKALNDEVFSQPGMSDEDLGQLIEVLRRFRLGAGDFYEGQRGERVRLGAVQEPAVQEPAVLGVAGPALARPEPARPEPAGPEPAGPEPAGPEPAGPEPAGPEPAGPEPAGPEPAGPEPAGPEPAGPEPVRLQPVRLQPVRLEPEGGDGPGVA